MKIDQKGYLLINLVAGIGIIALMIGISLPYIRNYQIDSKLSAEARNISGNLRHAQQLSVTNQTVHGVEFDIVSDTYYIKKYGGSTTTVKSVVLDSTVDLEKVTGLTGDRVKFNFYGGVDRSGEVILTNVNNSTSTVKIKPSGYVEIE